MERKCIKCNSLKETDEFTIGINICKLCTNAYCRLKYKNNPKYKESINRWNKLNRERRAKTVHDRYIREKEEIKKKGKEREYLYYKDKRKASYIENKVERAAYSRKYYVENKEKILKKKSSYLRNRYKKDPNFRILSVVRSRINGYLRYKGIKKSKRTIELLGCTVSELKVYLESKFLPTMSWENYGRLWQVDHIIPCSSFDLTIAEQLNKCFHYSNLQPLFTVTTIINEVEYIGNLNKANKIL